MPSRKVVVIGLLGTTLDVGHGAGRWSRWRPTVALAQHKDFVVHRLELLHGGENTPLAETVAGDIARCSPETEVIRHRIALDDPWDFRDVSAPPPHSARAYPFDVERE